MHGTGTFRRPLLGAALGLVLPSLTFCAAPQGAGDGLARAGASVYDQAGTLWAPYLEWAVENPSY